MAGQVRYRHRAGWSFLVDARNHTTHPEIWAGGDNTLGPDLAVNAMAAGRTAAEGILASFSFMARFRRAG